MTGIDGIKVELSARQEVSSLEGALAVVTGASSGIGRAITVALSDRGAHVCAVARSSSGLAITIAAAKHSPHIIDFPIDITADQNLESLLTHLQKLSRLDILIHCAGVIQQGRMNDASIEDLDLQYATNVRAPYLLTKRLLPLLTATRGQVVFVNSSAGLSAKRAEVGQYAASKHALKAIADSLREELNPRGVRVLSVYLGRTATPMQESLFQQEGKEYHPEMLLQPEDVASMILHSLTLPRTAEVTDISIRPMRNSY